MKRASFLAATAAAMSVPSLARAAATADASYNLTTATGTLGGTLSMPAGVAKPPVALIIGGSGPVNRDGNAGRFSTNMYRMLADALAAQGIASVRYDKRGIGESAAAAPHPVALRFETFIDDAAAWIAKLRADTRFAKVGIAGHSEGSLIGMNVGGRSPLDAFVSLEGAGRPGALVLKEQFAARLKDNPKLLADANRIVDSLAAGKLVMDIPIQLSGALGTPAQAYLISWMAHDPRADIAKLNAPKITVVQGTADIQVSVADARALVAAKPSAKLDIVDGMMHLLKQVGSMSAHDQIEKAYLDPNLPLDPAVPKAVAAALA